MGVLGANQSFYYISIFPFVMVFVVLPVFFEQIKTNELSDKVYKALSIFVAAALLSSCANWFVRNNQAY